MSLSKVKGVGWTVSLVASIAVCSGVASADETVLTRDLVRSGCSGGVFCDKPIVLPFTTTSTSPNVSAKVSNIVGNLTKCPQIAVTAVFDGGGTKYFFPVANGTPIPLPPGNHSVSLDGVCQQQGPPPFLFDHWGAHINIFGSPAPAQAPPAAAAHTVTGDVDLYDKPGGNGRKIGMLRKGDAVTLAGACPMSNPNNHNDATNGWCMVTDTTQNTKGAVWGEFISK